MTDIPHLSVRNLSKVFATDLFVKPHTAIDNITCFFPEGKCIGLMGHNGAGKTTTIKTIFGLLKPSKGEILFKGRPLQVADKSEIGYMPEVNKLAANLTCKEILQYHMKIYRPKGVAKKLYPDLIEKKLREVELWDARHKKVTKLSKGMGRRLSWSQATIHNPDLVILDEPFSGLDPLGRKLMSRLIESIRQESKTIILCTHELGSVYQICDELHILQQGKLAFSTINPQPNQLPAPIFSYKLKITGIDSETLAKIQKQHSLPDWEFLHTEDLLHTLGFDDYIHGIKWIRCLIENGILFTEFRKHQGFEELDLEQYFIT